MKNNLKYLILGIFVSILFPLVGDAASLSFEGAPSENTAKYDIKYSPDETPFDTINIEIDKTNDDLTYELTSELGTCSNLKCNNLLTTTLTTETVVATLTITNTTADSQKTVLNVKGSSNDVQISGATKEFTLKSLQTTTTTTTTQAVLNTDTSLSSINLSVGTMDQAFNKDITTYNVTGIKDTINSVTITPNCDNNCSWVVTCPLGECTVSNSRRVSLQTGANKVSISVTSEDGQNNKSYILNIYRGEIETSSAYLSDIKITDATLSPNFDSMTNDYTTTVGLDVDKLDIMTTPEDPEANVVIKGNENLVEGENTVTITVTSSDGENKQVYTIIVTKEEIDEEETEEKDKVPTKKVEKKKNNLWLIITLSVVSIAIIVVVFIIIFKKKKKKNNKNDNDKNGGTKINSASDILEENSIEKENTETLNILDETRKQLKDEPKQDIDEALDDLMMTKRLELGDLDLYS